VRYEIMDKVYNGIVIFGGMGAGKDALASQFTAVRESSKIYNIGVLCREMMKVAKVNPAWRGLERYIGQTTADKLREMDANIMCDYILALIYERGQKKYGWDNSNLEGDEYNKALLKQLSLISSDELSIIVGGRTLQDLDYWKAKNFLAVGVKVSDEVRKARLVSRDGEKTASNSSSQHNTEVDVPHIVNDLCDEIIYNDGTLEQLREAARQLLDKYNL
jgi:dephospho-CoA kinase